MTAIDQITSKPQRIMFLRREPLVPSWAPVKEVAKSQLTLLPNCKEPGCITLLAALSIPEEVFFWAESRRSHHPGLHGLLCSWGKLELQLLAGGVARRRPGRGSRSFASSSHQRRSCGTCPCGWGGQRVHARLLAIVPTVGTAYSITRRERHSTGLLRVQDPRRLLPCSPPPESIWAGERARPHLHLP